MADGNPFGVFQSFVQRPTQDGLLQKAQTNASQLRMPPCDDDEVSESYSAQHLIGSLSAGKLADLILLDQNFFTVDDDEISRTRVVRAILDGKTVFEA